MNIKDSYIHNGEAILKDILVSGSKLQKLKAGKDANDAYLTWVDVLDLSPFGASGHNHDDRYLKLGGGTLTGILHLLGSQYSDSANTGALDLANSDIYGVNSIKFSDLSDGAGEGLQWYRDATHVDSLWVNNGVIYFSPNRTWGGSVTNYTLWHSGNDGSGSGLDADKLDGYHATYGNNKPWGTIPVITTGGYMDVGKHFEFHYDNTTGSDYSTALMCTGNYGNIVNLPSISGTLALTSQIPTKASWNYDDVYLKLAGGNLTGKLTIKTNYFGNQLALDRGSDGGTWGPSITFYNNGTFLACLGVDTSGNLYKGDNGNINYVIYHAGNLSPMTTSHPANSITKTNIDNWNAVHTWYTIATSDDKTNTIDTWKEIEAFVSSFTKEDNLATYLANNYLAKSGGTMTGDIKFTNKGIVIVPGNTDLYIWKVFSSTDGLYGFKLQYDGTGSENDNSLTLIADNQSGEKVRAYSIKQDGTITFATTPKVGTNNILHLGNSSVTGGGSSWGSSITVNIGGTSKTLTIPTNPNTDYRVTQTVSTSGNTDFRPLLVGDSSSAAVTPTFSTITSSTIATTRIFVKPSTGDLHLFNPDGGDSPFLYFQRGDLNTNGTFDWRMYVSSGNFYVLHDYGGWTNSLSITYDNNATFAGNVYANNFYGYLNGNISGNAAYASSAGTATNATNANYFIGCTNTITVAGDSNTYYPVMVSTTANKKFRNIITVWKDLGSKTASYSGNHDNGTSSMLYRYDIRNCYWDGNGGYCTTLDARYMYARLVSETMMLNNGVGNFCIWLRGGGTEYNISTSWNISLSDITVYYSSTNVGSSTYPVIIAPKTSIGNGGIYNNISIPCDVKYAYSAGNVAWDNITGKPTTATRWPSWSEVTDKPTFTTWSETSSAATYSLSNAAWTNTISLPNTAGSYILNITSGNSTLTGVFSIGVGDTKDEISLHLNGNGPRLYARTNGTILQLSSSDNNATSRSVTIKYRRMI